MAGSKMRLFCLGLFCAASAFAGQPAVKPNVIVILTDDQGYQDLGCYGSPDIRTPNIDAMAQEGMRFTDFYVGAAVCSASRAALLTGRYPLNVGVKGVFFPGRGHQGLAPEHETIAEMLKGVGYATKAIGKWHLGDELEFLPTNQGFDSYFGIPYSNDMFPSRSMKYAKNCLFREGQSLQTLDEAFSGELLHGANPQCLTEKVPLMRDTECIEFPVDQTTITRRYTDEAIRFVQENAEKPFFLYLAHSMPHYPLFASPDFAGKSARGAYGDVVEEIDYNIGRLLKQLRQLKIEENTLVIFLSDNGPWLIKGKDGGCALPLFEGKRTQFEGGQRVPGIFKWPGTIPAASTCSEMVLSMDILPTVARITGATLPAAPLDGLDILDLLTAEKGAATPHEFFFFGTKAVRSGDWKYHEQEEFRVKETARSFDGPTLYNLKTDIGEAKNVIEDYPEVAERLHRAVEKQQQIFRSKK